MPHTNTYAHGHRQKKRRSVATFKVRRFKVSRALPALLALLTLSLIAAPANASTAKATDTGSAEFAPAPPTPATTPGLRATIAADGRTAIAPLGAPLQVQQAIWAANKITSKPYIWGGGHRRWRDRGYDCSGTVSYALHGGGLLNSPL